MKSDLGLWLLLYISILLTEPSCTTFPEELEMAADYIEGAIRELSISLDGNTIAVEFEGDLADTAVPIFIDL